jgi:hypothetical protein
MTLTTLIFIIISLLSVNITLFQTHCLKLQQRIGIILHFQMSFEYARGGNSLAFTKRMVKDEEYEMYFATNAG